MPSRRRKPRRKNQPRRARLNGRLAMFDRVVGKLHRRRSRWYVDPIYYGRRKEEIQVTNQANGRSGDFVLVERMKQVSDSRFSGLATEVIRRNSTATLASDALIKMFHVREDWPKSLDLSEIPDKVDPSSLTSRTDLRQRPFVTIDGAKARDFDDAVYAERCDDGWLLSVAIADVAHYVKEDSTLDRVARRRGNSIYLPDRVVPMLPEELSNGICSLKPKVDRLALVCDMRIDTAGVVIDFEIYESMISSVARLTYDEVEKYLQDGPLDVFEEVGKAIKSLHALQHCLRHKRIREGSLDLINAENAIILENGEPIDCVALTASESHRLIEEAMLLCNKVVARYLESHQVEPLYRVHPPPSLDSLYELRKYFNSIGIRLPLEVHKASTIQRALDELDLEPGQLRIWHRQVIRSMSTAEYRFSRIGHFGLAFESYLHFTSPIRRYADLYTHRQVKALLRKGPTAQTTPNRQNLLAESLSKCEHTAETIENKVNIWLKTTRAEPFQGSVVQGTVVGVSEFGLQVELDRFFVIAFLHRKQLPYDRYHFRGTSLIGDRTGFRLSFGDRLSVRILSVVAYKGDIDVKFVDKCESERAFKSKQS